MKPSEIENRLLSGQMTNNSHFFWRILRHVYSGDYYPIYVDFPLPIGLKKVYLAHMLYD